MNGQSTFFNAGIVIVLIFSKFFYLSIFSLGGYNFTLSDLCLILMVLLIANKTSSIKKPYKYIFIISFMLIPVFSIGSLIQGTSVSSGILIFIKRWLSLLIIPIFINLKVRPKDTPIVIYSILFTTVLYAIINWSSLVQSVEITRFNEGFNPNILGIVMAMNLIIILSTKELNIFFVYKTVFIIVSFIILLAVSSRGAIFTLIPVLFLLLIYANKRITPKKILISMFLGIFCTLLMPQIFDIIQNHFSYSYTRLSDTLMGGVLNDRSASSRISTLLLMLQIVFGNLSLLLFGTGFGNSNMLIAFSNYGFIIATGDNMYINLLAWTGIFGIIGFISIILILSKNIYKSNNNPYRLTVFLLTAYILLAGATTDTLIEPTVGTLYFTIIGLFECANKINKEKI